MSSTAVEDISTHVCLTKQVDTSPKITTSYISILFALLHQMVYTGADTGIFKKGGGSSAYHMHKSPSLNPPLGLQRGPRKLVIEYYSKQVTQQRLSLL